MKKTPFSALKGVKPAKHILGAIQTIDAPMCHYQPNEEVDFCIVGVGSAGGVLVQRLARAGFQVIGIEAGPFWDTERDWVSDEAGSYALYWNELRITGGTDPVPLGANNSGRGVGGGSVHWAGFTPRFHPSDFRVYSEDGVSADWPISYQDLKPYYELLEKEIPVSGPAYFPWGNPHGYPYGPHPIGGIGDVLDGLEGACRDVEAAGGKALVLPTDVADADQVEVAAAKVEEILGPIDIWINNAMTSVF